MRRPPALYKWMVERPGRFYIAVRTACVRRRIRSSAPRELLRRPTILAGEEPTDEADPVHEEQPESRTLGDPPSVHPAPTPATERQSRAEPPHRSGGVLGPAPLPRLRGGRWTPSSLGDHVQLHRFSLALQGRTPAEKLAALRPPLRAA